MFQCVLQGGINREVIATPIESGNLAKGHPADNAGEPNKTDVLSRRLRAQDGAHYTSRRFLLRRVTAKRAGLGGCR